MQHSVTPKSLHLIAGMTCLTRMKTQADRRLSGLKPQLNAVIRRNTCKVLGGTEYRSLYIFDNQNRPE